MIGTSSHARLSASRRRIRPSQQSPPSTSIPAAHASTFRLAYRREEGQKTQRSSAVHKEANMSTATVRTNDPNGQPSPAKVDMKFEIVVIPVSDVDRAKEFYGRLGWRLDADYDSGKDFRVIQFTPPASGCSIIFGKNVTPAAPGSAQGLYLIVSDIQAARKELLDRGIAVSEVFHHEGDTYTGSDEPYLFGRVRVPGPDPKRGTYRSFASFSDPDGNG